MRLLKFIRIIVTSIAFMWVSDYVGQAVELANEAWREEGKV